MTSQHTYNEKFNALHQGMNFSESEKSPSSRQELLGQNTKIWTAQKKVTSRTPHSEVHKTFSGKRLGSTVSAL